MNEISNSKPKYDIEEKTFQFAKSVRMIFNLENICYLSFELWNIEND